MREVGGEVEEGVFEEGFLEEKNGFLPFTSPEGIVDPLATQKIEVRPEKFVRITIISKELPRQNI